jgi:predicted Zn-dependent peptidase
MNDPDALALDLALDLLRWRLDDDLRTKSGFTYGVGGSNNDARLGAPPIVLRTAIEREHVGEAVQTILREVRTLSADPISEKHLAIARDEAIDGLGTRFETTDKISMLTSILPFLGLPIDEYATWPKRLAALQPDDLQRVAKRYVSPDAVQIVIVGDEKTIRPLVEAAMTTAPPADDGAKPPAEPPPPPPAAPPP